MAKTAKVIDCRRFPAEKPAPSLFQAQRTTFWTSLSCTPRQ